MTIGIVPSYTDNMSTPMCMLSTVQNTFKAHAKCVTGASGFTYTGLSVGSHMIEVRFTPDGLSQIFSFDSPLQFNVLLASTPIQNGNYYYYYYY